MPLQPTAQIPIRRRNAEASRQAILDAAETIFAAEGFDRASLQSIGRRAGVSAALPAYFFAGKEGLYRAMMERLLAAREARLGPLAAAAGETLEATGDLRAGLRILIDGYIDFLCERQSLVRLMGREALDGGRRLGPEPRHSVAVEDALGRVLRWLGPRTGQSVDPQQLLITTVGLCFFPLEHNDTMLAAIGLDATSRGFIERRKHHVVDVLVGVLGPSTATD
jgi:TetR/AcrR family transcriptional regulator